MRSCTLGLLAAILTLSAVGCSLTTSIDGLSGNGGHGPAMIDMPTGSDDAGTATDETDPTIPTMPPVDASSDMTQTGEAETAVGCSDPPRCRPLTCTNGEKDGNETAIDCGGSCDPCADGTACLVASDCGSKVCSVSSHPVVPPPTTDAANVHDAAVDGVIVTTAPEEAGAASTEKTCQPPSCSDRVMNGNEPDVDCGGPCPKCPSGAGCSSWADCQSGVCKDGRCAVPTCGDGLTNGSETGLDCGGTCPPCPTGQKCLSPADCASKVCKSEACQAPSCSDSTKNGAETDVDCGGGTCSKCATGRHCETSNDCQDAWCRNGACR